MITVGRRDELGLFAPAKAFSKRLDAKGLGHTFAPTDDGHVAPGGVRGRGVWS